jgi:hypothetical protein
MKVYHCIQGQSIQSSNSHSFPSRPIIILFLNYASIPSSMLFYQHFTYISYVPIHVFSHTIHISVLGDEYEVRKHVFVCAHNWQITSKYSLQYSTVGHKNVWASLNLLYHAVHYNFQRHFLCDVRISYQAQRLRCDNVDKLANVDQSSVSEYPSHNIASYLTTIMWLTRNPALTKWGTWNLSCTRFLRVFCLLVCRPGM